MPSAKKEVTPKEKLVGKTTKAEVTEPKKTDLAKAGKRSSKSIKEKEVKATKEINKSEEKKVDKPKVKKTRSKIERKGKKYQKKYVLIDKEKNFTALEAINLVKSISTSNFDGTLEAHINLAVDPKLSDQNVRDTIVLPNGLGKKIKIAVISDDPTVAKDAGADYFSAESIFSKLDKGQIEFQTLISTPSQMPKLGKYARILGPRGLMPNPKSGTVTNDIKKAVKDAKTGKIEYRVDSTGIVHVGIGKLSFEDKLLEENFNSIITSLKHNKPQSVKGSFIKNINLAPTMGPSVKVDLASIN
ncbi:MAG TPA: 50S ribosomal protein L1 [Patescibacteria group bacterium]|nr:50S ribosomal protein L1 [Patescibacteria group bacterium]